MSSLIEGKIIRFVYDVNIRRNIDLVVLLSITHTPRGKYASKLSKKVQNEATS